MTRNVLEISLVSDALPGDETKLVEIRGRERISELFEFEITLYVPAGLELKPSEVAGSTAMLRFTLNGHEQRRVYGLIASVVDLLDSESDFAYYKLRFVPEAWRLGVVRIQEITIGQSLPAIIEKKLDQVGLDKRAAFLLQTPVKPREFVVQYDETDLAFMNRITEHVGWSYYFDHTGEQCRIVFTDHAAGFRRTEGHGAHLAFHKRGDNQGVFSLQLDTRLVPAVYGVNDFNYLRPLDDISAIHELNGAYAGGVIEYGTNYGSKEEGDLFAKVRAEEASCRTQVYRGEASVCTITAGARVKLMGHPRLADETELLIISCEHHVVLKREKEDGEPRFLTTFEAIPAETLFRPERLTPRPRISGLMSGVIEADPGVSTEQAWIDDHGRYLVRMLFESAVPNERPASLPIRMSQPHAGPGYGMHFPLRPGTEVMVAFIAGDPDRPIIVGAIPNAVTPTPVDEKIATRHRIKTWSGIQVEFDDGG